jgi:Chemoreceptor zinc-binding domain
LRPMRDGKHACEPPRSGKFDAPTDTVRADNQCEFGKWLYGSELSAAEKQTSHYLDVKQLHTQFHQEAAKMVHLANSGEKTEAEKAINMRGNYAKSSSALTSAMIRWRDSLH